MTKNTILTILAGIALIFTTMVASAGPASAQSATVRLTVTKAGFIVGMGGGHGTLRFKGRVYRLRVGGISAGTIGVAQANLVGTAHHLHRPQDIAGIYSAASASIAVAGGAKVATLQNEKGVVLNLQGKQVGFEASLNLSGISLALE